MLILLAQLLLHSSWYNISPSQTVEGEHTHEEECVTELRILMYLVVLPGNNRPRSIFRLNDALSISAFLA